MNRITIGSILLGMAGIAHAQTAGQCASQAPAAMPVKPTLVAPLSPELVAPAHQLGAPTGVLAQAFDESLSVDNVLFRQRLQDCLAVANAVPAKSPSLPSPDNPAGYKPKTEFDNTPWRFDMSQNGKRMTAEEFDAWMKARGVRVAKGAPATPAPPPEPPKPAEKKK